MKKLLIIPFICSSLYAGVVDYVGRGNIQYDDSVSHKNLQGHYYLDESSETVNNKVIYNSLFYSEIPGTVIFPDVLITTFVKCNLQNIVIPAGSTLIDCNVDWFEAQNDMENWKVDKQTLAPIEPIDKEKFIDLGISIAPKDIPIKKIDEPISNKKRLEKIKDELVVDLQKQIDELKKPVSEPIAEPIADPEVTP